MSITSLPVLDLSLAQNPDTAEQFRTQLREATHEVGFFYLVGHGIPDELQRRLLAVAREFFALPTARSSRSRTSAARTSVGTPGSAAN